MARILLADDERSLRDVVGFVLAEAGHDVVQAADGDEAVRLFDADPPDLVLTDLRMPGRDGMAVLEHVRRKAPGVPVIMLTAYGTVEQAVAAMKAGAATYLLKPCNRDELRLTVEQALRTRELEHDVARMRRSLRERPKGPPLLHASATMRELLARAAQVAASEAPALLLGESGTGKELLARALHDMSPRADGPFVAVNCGAVPDSLFESELFGHRRGAFTGAVRDAPGRLRAAAGGTLFLDEIGELPLPLQPKLLRALETRTVDPVGGEPGQPADFRLVCATNVDLGAAVAAGEFREDLYYRLNVVPLTLPPLRERAEDVPLLWDHFTELHAERRLRTTPELMAALQRRPWPGNVRELRNLNQRLVILRTGDELGLADLERAGGGAAEPASGLPLGPFPEEGFSLPALEKEVVRRALSRFGGNRTRAAAYLGIPRHVLVYRIEKYGLKEA